MISIDILDLDIFFVVSIDKNYQYYPKIYELGGKSK